jgi:hypothetical protein
MAHRGGGNQETAMSVKSHEEFERNEENLRHRDRRLACRICDGVGFTTIWQLITYKGKSLSVRHKVTLDGIDSDEAAMAFQREIIAAEERNPKMDSQIVLSAARKCVCHA